MNIFNKQALRDIWLTILGVIILLGGAVVVGLTLKAIGAVLRWYGFETDL